MKDLLPSKSLSKLSDEASAACAPRPPEELVGALQDRMHIDSGALLSAKRVDLKSWILASSTASLRVTILGVDSSSMDSGSVDSGSIYVCSDSEDSGYFPIGINAEQHARISALPEGSDIDIEAVVSRNMNGIITGGRLISFETLSQEDPHEAWRLWFCGT